VVWSFSTVDPTDPLGADARYHDYRGSRSLNLLGGVTTTSSDGDQFVDIRVDNVSHVTYGQLVT
jgi:hypothetical protein